MEPMYPKELSDEGKKPEYYKKLRKEFEPIAHPKLKWPPNEVIQKWGVVDNVHGLRCATIYAIDEVDAEHQWIMMFGKNPGYGFIIASETTSLVHTRNYYPPGQEPIIPVPKQVEYDTWYQPYEVN